MSFLYLQSLHLTISSAVLLFHASSASWSDICWHVLQHPFEHLMTQCATRPGTINSCASLPQNGQCFKSFIPLHRPSLSIKSSNSSRSPSGFFVNSSTNSLYSFADKVLSAIQRIIFDCVDSALPMLSHAFLYVSAIPTSLPFPISAEPIWLFCQVMYLADITFIIRVAVIVVHFFASMFAFTAMDKLRLLF